MRKLSVFNAISLDGYFTDSSGDMSFAIAQGPDEEYDAFTAGNATGDAALLFGRVTYETMAGFWRTDEAKAQMPEVAGGMERLPKYVASRTLAAADWSNTALLAGPLVSAVRTLKASAGPDIVILGSGQIVAQLTEARLIDGYQVVICPVAIGAGRTMFEGVTVRPTLKRIACRNFANGKVAITYDVA
jgi:dihydrofolate reductase